MPLDQKRMQAAVDSAYDDAVSKEFETLMVNLADAASKTPGYVRTEDQAVGMFSNGMKWAEEAYAKGCALVQKQFPPNA